MAISAFARLLPFLEEQMQSPLGIGTAVPNRGAEWLRPTGGSALSEDGSSSLEGILQNAARARTVTTPKPDPIATRPRTVTPPSQQGTFTPREFPGISMPQEEPEVYANERNRYADPLDQYKYEHGVMHGGQEHRGFWNRLKHIGLGALSGGIGIAQGGANQDLGSLIGGMLGGGIFGGAKPESADRLWDRFVIEPEGEREYKKKLIQEQIQFEREKRKLDLENVRGSITGRKWSQAMEELQARTQWDQSERQRWYQEQQLDLARQAQERADTREARGRVYVSSGYYLTENPDGTWTEHKAPGFDERYGQGRYRGFSPASISSALERMDPIAKIVADTYANDPDAPYRIIAEKYGTDKAEQVRATHEMGLGLRDRDITITNDVMRANADLLKKAEAAAKAQMEINAKGSRGLQVEWLRHPANAWDPNRDEKPSFPTDQQIRDFLQANPYSDAAPSGGGGGGATSDQMTFPPEGGVTPTPAGTRDRIVSGRIKKRGGPASKWEED